MNQTPTSNVHLTPQRIFLKDYEAPHFTIESVFLKFHLHETATRVISKLQMKKNSAISLPSQDLKLNGENLKLISVAINEKSVTSAGYKIDDESLTIMNVPNEFQLEIEVEINPEANKSCEGLYLSSGIFCTQCEAESFRKITYFLDRPDVMTSYTVEIIADRKKYPHLLSNGDCIEKTILSDTEHRTVWKDPFKKPSYLFALVAGDLGVIEDHFTTQSGKKVKLEVYAPHGKQDRCYHALESLKNAMKWDEERFGLEYDLNQYMIVSIDDFNMGAMENKGLNVFNSRLVLADKKSATDHDFYLIESVVGHEYFHNWSGNRVTCRNWFELSLKEGLTVFRDQEFSADMTSASVQRISDVTTLKARQFSEDASPNAHAVRPESCLAVDNFYTATIYEKGAEIIRMIQTLIGREAFKKGIKHYFTTYDGQAVTILDFVNSMETVSGKDLTQFKLWYSQAGTPQIEVIENYNSSTQTYELTLKQTYPLTQTEQKENFKKSPFHIPLIYSLYSTTNTTNRVFDNHKLQLIELKENCQTWTFPNITEKPILSLNQNFSAPVKLNWNRSNEELIYLMKYDLDAYNRKDAATTMLTQEVFKLLEDTSHQPQTDIIEAMGAVLNDSQIDPEFKSMALSLPLDSVLLQELKVFVPQELDTALQKLAQTFAQQFKNDLLKTYHAFKDQDHKGARALKNKVLSFLSSLETDEIAELAHTQYIEAKNMTDSISALAILNKFENKFAFIDSQDFHQKWHTDSVVMNKWLSLQAQSAHSTFEKVKAATHAAGYDQNNPNNIYSLHVAFTHNYKNFHNNNSEIYKWYGEELKRMDKLNPQVSARMAGGFSLIQKLPANMKKQATEVIIDILKDPQFSKNAREILEKYVN